MTLPAANITKLCPPQSIKASFWVFWVIEQIKNSIAHKEFSAPQSAGK